MTATVTPNNAVLSNGRQAMATFNESTAKLESALHKGIYALCVAVGTSYEYETDRFMRLETLTKAAHGKGTDESTKEARRILADGVFGFDSVNSTKTNNLNPTNSQAQFIVRCAVVASYIMAGYTSGTAWELTVNGKGEIEAGRVALTTRGSRLMVPGSLLVDDEHPDYDRVITLNGERGKAVADLLRKAKADYAKGNGAERGANDGNDIRKKTLNAILGSNDTDVKQSGIAGISDVLTEELAKVAKGGKLAEGLRKSLSNLSAHMTEISVAEGDADMDYMGVTRDFLTIARNLDKMPEGIRTMVFEIHGLIEDYIADHAMEEHATYLRKVA